MSRLGIQGHSMEKDLAAHHTGPHGAQPDKQKKRKGCGEKATTAKAGSVG
jgi:hypothetical protein